MYVETYKLDIIVFIGNVIMCLTSHWQKFFSSLILTILLVEIIGKIAKLTYIYNIRTLSENIKFICTSFRNGSFSSLFRSECKLILYSTTMYVYCVYPAVSKIPTQLTKLSETSIVLIVFNGVIYDVSAYTVTVSFCHAT